MAKINLDELKRWVFQAVKDNPDSLPAALSRQFGVSRQTANNALKTLVDEGWLIRHGTTRPHYAVGLKWLISHTYSLPIEDVASVWEKDFQPYFALPPNIQAICLSGFSEVINNASTHSAGSTISIDMMQDDQVISIAISDNGIGIFQGIANVLSIGNMSVASLELLKGNFNLTASNHKRNGFLAASRLLDCFTIQSNHLQLQWLNTPSNWSSEPCSISQGTTVRMEIALTSLNVPDNKDDSISHITIPVKLLYPDQTDFVARSAAKHLVRKLENFSTVVLDFEGIDEIGQGFSDQTFRVFLNQHPHISLSVINTSDRVKRMIGHVNPPTYKKIIQHLADA